MVEKEKMVREVFRNISAKYDFFDSLMSFGMDNSWRRKIIDLLELRDWQVIFDAGAGSGKVSEEILSRGKRVEIQAIDITEEMFPRHLEGVHFNVASAEEMPFGDDYFDRGVSCFLTRNVPSLESYLREAYRVLKPGAIFCNMDIFDPGKTFIAPAFRLYFYKIVPSILDMASRSNSYTYLAGSVRNFVTPGVFTDIMRKTGFREIDVTRLAAGTVYIHRGLK
ncbi:MAG: class I SAM-dependent methyltransferase [Candidatus Thermoplasmatota archaeon]|nr:class I SAM-dependent methyltransferase [Candidatus Thermoplasmatota archaeon]MCL5791348.1 class I SAM-dependent methyltransferase [Candidatus Thermoplasmatota archaeon]